MTLTATRTKAALASTDFTGVASLTDPHDGSSIDALTNFNFRLVPFVGPVLDPTIVDAFTRRVGTDLMLVFQRRQRSYRFSRKPVLFDHPDFGTPGGVIRNQPLCGNLGLGQGFGIAFGNGQAAVEIDVRRELPEDFGTVLDDVGARIVA